MNTFRYTRVVRDLRRALFISLITGPAFGFFMLFMSMAFNNSLSATFLKEARALVGGVPAGQVRICIQPDNTFPADRDIRTAPVFPDVKPPVLMTCRTVFVSENEWLAHNDRTIRSLYSIFATLGFLCWLSMTHGPSALVEWLRRRKRQHNA